MNSEYTQIWTSDFSENELAKYYLKFFRRIEKNIKHRELINFVSKYYNPKLSWCDFPIGPGRLFNTIKPNPALSFGCDISDEFLNHNRILGWLCEKKDLNSFSLPQKFDLITCTNTLFAFPNNREIMKNFTAYLKPGGVFITDLVNKDHILSSEKDCGKYDYHSGYFHSEIQELANFLNCEVLEVRLHDYYDNRYVGKIFDQQKKSRLFTLAYRALNKAYFSLDLFLAFEFFRSKNKNQYMKYLVAFRRKE